MTCGPKAGTPRVAPWICTSKACIPWSSSSPPAGLTSLPASAFIYGGITPACTLTIASSRAGSNGPCGAARPPKFTCPWTWILCALQPAWAWGNGWSVLKKDRNHEMAVESLCQRLFDYSDSDYLQLRSRPNLNSARQLKARWSSRLLGFLV